MRVSLRQIQAFHEVAKCSSFTMAAQNMNLTQSAVSMLVRQMELELDLKLFDRVNRSAKLTEVGTHLLPTVERVISDMQNVVDGAADLKALHRGTLRLAIPQMLACSWLPPLLSQYRSLHPEIEIDLTDVTGDKVVRAVDRNTAEIGIGPERAVPSGIAARELWAEDMQVVIPRSSPLAASTEGIDWDQIQDQTWIHYSDEFSRHLASTVWARSPNTGIAPIRVRSLTTALAMVSSGHGLTAAPSYANVFEDQFDVAFRPMKGKDTGRLFYLYQRAGTALSPAAVSFIALLDAHLER